jgi:ATP phosphoribosyltransferase
MSAGLVFAVPSKGRLMEQAAEFLAASGLKLRKVGHERGYRGEIEGLAGVDVAFISASEIVAELNRGRAHIGVTGEDIVRENISNAEDRVQFLKKLGFGRADVVVAVPQCWIDVNEVADLEAAAVTFRREHGRPFRVATKYVNLTRRFFSGKGLLDYRIVESLGATEGTPAAGTADIIVDITTTGATLAANGLKVLGDGVILRSEANLVASKVAAWPAAVQEVRDRLLARLGIAAPAASN